MHRDNTGFPWLMKEIYIGGRSALHSISILHPDCSRGGVRVRSNNMCPLELKNSVIDEGTFFYAMWMNKQTDYLFNETQRFYSVLHT